MDKDVIRYRFSDGTVMEGTIDAVVRYANHIGETVNVDGYHYSASNGRWMKISDMHDLHIRNAIIRTCISGFKELSNPKVDNSTFIKSVLLLSNTISQLFMELERREANKR